MTQESDLVRVTLQWLRLVGIPCFRNNTGAYKRGNGWIRYGSKGSGDILGILPGGRWLSIELKVGKNKPSKDQLEFMDMISSHGGVAFAAWSIDEVIERIEAITKTKEGQDG